MEFTDELENSPAAIDFCRLAEVLKEQHLIAVVAHLSIDDIVTLASGRKTLPLGHAHEETCQPAAEAAAKNHQALPIQLVEQQRRLPRPRLQRVEELNEVFLGDGIGRSRRQLAQQVIDDGRIQTLHVTGQVCQLGGRIGDYSGRRVASEAFLVDRSCQEGIEGGSDKQLQRTDVG